MKTRWIGPYSSKGEASQTFDSRRATKVPARRSMLQLFERGHRANDCLGTKGEIPDKTKKERTANTTKVNAVKKKDVVLVETETIETSDSDNESENE